MRKIEWCPIWDVSLRRRLEVLATGGWMYLILFGELAMLLAYVWYLVMGNLYIKTICLLYFGFIYYDRKAGESGGRGQGSQWFRNWKWWQYYANYFPVSLVKTAELPADRNYLFAAFPHGILSSSAFCNFGANGTTFKADYPGIRSKCVTLGFHFHIPIFREVLLSWGMGSCSAKSLNNILSQSNSKSDPKNQDGYSSNAVVVMVGGAQESLHSRPDNYVFVLKKRKGFVKIALRNGASLVPVISFGELDLFDQPPNPPGSKLRRWQEFVKNVTGIAAAKFIGRGFFQYTYGMIPRRKPVFTVVGAPIDVPKIPEPSQDEIDKYHAEFCTKIRELFETHKAKYIVNHKNVNLVLE